MLDVLALFHILPLLIMHISWHLELATTCRREKIGGRNERGRVGKENGKEGGQKKTRASGSK